MAWQPISGICPQATESGNQADGYVWKFYESGTTTPLAMAIDSAGATTSTDFLLDSEGYATLSGNRVIIHADQAYKEVLYLNQTDADANDTGSAVYVIDGVNVGLDPGSITIADIEALDSAKVIIGQTLGNAQVALSGDVTMSETGVTTIGASTIETSMIQNDAVTEDKLSDDLVARLVVPKGFFWGVDTSSSNNNDINLTEGLVADTTGSYLLTVAAQTANLKSRITSGGNLAGGSTPSAGATYYGFVVAEADGSNPKIGYDSDINATNALADWSTQTGNTYTLYRLIDLVPINGSSNIRKFEQRQGVWIYDGSVNDLTVNPPSGTNLFDVTVPSGVKVTHLGIARQIDASPSAQINTLITSPEQATSNTASATRFTLATGTGATITSVDMSQYRTNNSAKLRYDTDTLSDGVTLNIRTHGFKYER